MELRSAVVILVAAVAGILLFALTLVVSVSIERATRVGEGDADPSEWVGG